MINPHRIAELLSDLVSERLSLHDRKVTDSKRDEEIAKHLYHHVESILESTDYSFETEETIDFDDDANNKHLQKDEDEEDVWNEKQRGINDDDETYEGESMDLDNDRHHHLQKHFSLE